MFIASVDMGPFLKTPTHNHSDPTHESNRVTLPNPPIYCIFQFTQPTINMECLTTKLNPAHGCTQPMATSGLSFVEDIS